ncbi:TPA: hypothetical protein EYP45_02555 [Candidatus Peregrinibacteria bacterium]|nr:hypothetical protein [Candidatus Peregrinibacteria bacterium]
MQKTKTIEELKRKRLEKKVDISLTKKEIIFTEVEKIDEIKIRENYKNLNYNIAIDNRVLTDKIICDKNDEYFEKYKNAEILCVFIYSKITKKVLENMPNLKIIITRSVGYNHIDLVECHNKKIPVCNVPDYGSHVIAEHVFAMLLSSLRCIEQASDKTKMCDFNFSGLRGMALKGKTLGIIGTGKIGKKVARIASMGFLMDVIAYARHPDIDASLSSHFTYVDSLEEIWEKSDIISLHIPANKESYHIINKKSISQMKDGVVLVNTARGSLIETQALIDGVQSKKISHAVLDVVENEKHITDFPELQTMPEILITPHIAFYADDSMKKMYTESFQTIENFIKHKKLIHEIKEVE